MKIHTLVLAMLALSPVALAQNAGDAAHQPLPAKGEGPQAVPIPAPAPVPAFESLAKKGPDGKIVRLEGVSDIAAFHRNKLMTPSTMESIKPAVSSWLADVEQLAIDNQDFLEQLDPGDGKPGLLDKLNVDDKVLLTQMSQMMTQLVSAGPLTAHLESKGLLTREQSGANQQITGDYLQQCMNEIQSAPPPPEMAGDEAKAKAWRVNNLTKFLYELSCNDTLVAYRRMLADAAPNVDAIVGGMGLTGEQAAKVSAEVAGVKSAGNKLEQRRAVRKLMSHLSLEQKRQFLTKTRDLAPVKDPLAGGQS